MSTRIEGALSVMRRGLRETPELKRGVRNSVVLAFASAIGMLLVPVLIQQILDRGFAGGFHPKLVYGACSIAAVVTIAVYLSSRIAQKRMVRAAESAIKTLRIKTFRHIHRLSIAVQSKERRGTLVARVTADIDTLTQFMDWGAVAWITGTTLMIGTFIVMLVYSWQLALIVVFVASPILLVLRRLQAGLLEAYELIRARVSDTLSEFAESIMGAEVVRSYGMLDRTDRRIKRAIDLQYRAQMRSARYWSILFPLGDVFGAVAMVAVIWAGITFGPDWGLTPGRLVAFLFLISLFLQPVGELTETFDQTQTAIAGWRKVLDVLDTPVELVEPEPGIDLPSGALSVVTEGVRFDYGAGPVLKGIDVELEPGSHVAIVGQTGCGKTTFAKLLCRLADPTEGRIVVGGLDLRDVSPATRRRAIRMVPQDGFLFDKTIKANVLDGRPDATDAEIEAAFERLGLSWWVDLLPHGLDTHAGQRGERLSAGERQFVALVRSEIAQPGLLILDEATSSVDPETEASLAAALTKVSEGRTTITIAHRMSTAERADQVFVFDAGEVVERGRHDELVAAGGVYARLYASWLGNTRAVA
ncbi:MAG TPA: ABC transporter ATP-binding protein [Actinomycetota bacterium]|nr:ABC transporter ATP-binding protein [Actinomycetota bacterium]